MKKWKCTVCGYIHTGDQPPESCPVCGADKSKFVELQETENASVSNENATNATNTIMELIQSHILKRHLHPISVHIPNGIIPAIVLFVFIGAIFNFKSMTYAAFYNSIFVLLAMPVVLFTGYVEWTKRYGGNLTKMFIIKITCGIIVTLASLLLVVWKILQPEITSGGLYIFIHLVMLAAAGVAGHIGGKLVFKE